MNRSAVSPVIQNEVYYRVVRGAILNSQPFLNK
jgi:hypothetical protein